MRFFVLMWLCMLFTSAASAQSVFIEDLTWTEVQDAIEKGSTTAIYYAGSTEQNGPHMATGKHNFIARHVAERIALKLGNALVYPILPFAPTGSIEGRTGHMRYPGSVSLSEGTYVAVARDVAASARAAGFRTILIMADHGDGQTALANLADVLNSQWHAKGVQVFYIGDLHDRYGQLEQELLAKQRLNAGGHAGLADTASLMAVDKARLWVRPAAMKQAVRSAEVEGDPSSASAALGRRLVDLKVDTALRQIRALLAQPRRP